jgi:AcrR family transcriptional regulator
MGIKERQERDREAVRRSILDAARELFVSEGYQNVSIRKIAERIEYSPAAIYGYFPSKDDIFFALAEEGFHLLHRPHEVEHLSTSPLDAVRQILWQFYEFSVEQPQYFALMFVDRSVPSIRRVYERFAFARDMKQKLMSLLQSAVDEGALPKTVPPAVAFRLLVNALIGVATMRLSDRLSPGENADDIAHNTLDVTIAGLQSGIALRSQPPMPCDTSEDSESLAVSSTRQEPS